MILEGLGSLELDLEIILSMSWLFFNWGGIEEFDKSNYFYAGFYNKVI